MFLDHPLIKPFTKLEPNYFPGEEIRNAIAHQEEVTPLLLEALRDFADNPEGYSEEEGNCLHMVALILLGQFREAALFPVIQDISDRFDPDIWGEETAYEELIICIPEPAMARIIASVMANDIDKLKAIIIDHGQDIELRCRALEALKSCYFEGDLERSDLTHFLSNVFETFALQHDSPDFCPLWMVLYDLCLDIHPQEMLDDILRASEAGFIGEMINFRSLERAKEYCEGTPEQWLSNNRERLVKEFGYIREADKELEEWGMNQVPELDWDELGELTAAIEEKSRQRAVQNQAIGNAYSQIFHESSDTPFVREDTKTGRNDPCPCGSGKKYKKCCGR